MALSSDPAVSALACAPGNAGTRAVAEPLAVDATDPDAIAALAVAWRADLVVVGPEVPLVAGAADAVRDAGIACFGPSAEAAQLEGSKSFAKHVMTAAGVPTARAWPVGGPAELETALDEVAQLDPGAPYVVKDDGLAAGKGVLVTPDRAAAVAHGRAVLDAGRRRPDRGVPRRPRGVAVRAVGRDDGAAARARAGLQAPGRRRRRTQHRRDGGLRAAALGPAGSGGRRAGHRPAAHRGRDGPARRAVQRAAVRGAGADLARPAGGRVQRPLRRPRDPGRAAAAGDPAGRAAARRGHRHAGRRPAAALAGGLGGHRRRRRPGYPEAPRTGDPVSGADGEGVLHAGHRADRRTGSSSPPAAGCWP